MILLIVITDWPLAANELNAQFAVLPFILCDVKYQDVEEKTAERTVM